MSVANKISPFSKIQTPCIGVCSTVLGDAVCRGCKRYSHEIIRWNSFSEDEKRAIDARLEEFLQRVFNSYLEVSNLTLLQQKIQQYKIPVAAHRGPAAQAFALLRAGGEQVSPLEEFGLLARRAYQSWSAIQLRDAIDADFWQLSSAHYERYFQL